MAVPFDLDRLEVTAGSVPMVEGVRDAGTATGAAQFSLAADGTLAYVPGASSGVERSLVWVDRDGREESTSAPARDFEDPRLSPDGQRVAITTVNTDIWTFDLGRGTLTRLTFENSEDETPMWSPDSQWVAYVSDRGDQRTVFRRRADGSGAEELLWSASTAGHAHVEDWTSDGRSLVVSMFGEGNLRDLLVLPLDGDRTPVPLLRTGFAEQGARVSPDGRWIAYSSNESGRDEVYVQPFPSLGGKWQISTGGGLQPVWSPRGDELFYRGEGAAIAVAIDPASSFSAGAPRKLFADDFSVSGAGTHTGYSVTADGQRFLFLRDSTVTAGQIHFVLNWFEELRRRVGRN